jgi:hypothetical protein
MKWAITRTWQFLGSWGSGTQGLLGGLQICNFAASGPIVSVELRGYTALRGVVDSFSPPRPLLGRRPGALLCVMLCEEGLRHFPDWYWKQQRSTTWEFVSAFREFMRVHWLWRTRRSSRTRLMVAADKLIMMWRSDAQVLTYADRPGCDQNSVLSFLVNVYNHYYVG